MLVMVNITATIEVQVFIANILAIHYIYCTQVQMLKSNHDSLRGQRMW